MPVPAVLRDYLVERRLDTGEYGQVFGSANRARKMIERGLEAQREAGLDPFLLHDCRHSYASMMIAAGVNAKSLSEFLGHAGIGITFDLYGHLMPGSHGEAAGLLDALLARAAGGGFEGPTAPRTAPHPARSRS